MMNESLQSDGQPRTQRAFGRLWDRIRSHGPWWVLSYWVPYHLRWRWREWRLGISTTEPVSRFRLGSNPECVGYEPVQYDCFEQAMRSLNPTGDDVFLDVGCGRGRALVLAGLHPFGKIIGVERSPELCESARGNVRRAQRLLQCSSVEVVNQDATEFEVPATVSVVFLFNPFTGSVLKSVLGQIRKSLSQQPRPLRLLYLYPAQQENPLGECDWLIPIRTLPTGLWEKMRFTEYRVHDLLSNPNRTRILMGLDFASFLENPDLTFAGKSP